MTTNNERGASVSPIPASERAHAEEEVKASRVDEVESSTIDIEKSDLEKPGNVKGDDSDGRVDWTTRQIIATLSLTCLYVGESVG